MICPNCQKNIPDTAKACGYCGAWLDEKAVPPPIAREAVQPAGLPWLWLGLGAVVLVVVVTLLTSTIILSAQNREKQSETEATLAAVAATATDQARTALAPTATNPPPSATPVVVQPTPTSPPPSTPEPEISPVVPGAVSAADGELIAPASLRKQPDRKLATIAVLRVGTAVDLLGISEDRNWVLVKEAEQGQTGWIEVKNVKLNISLDDLEVVR